MSILEKTTPRPALVEGDEAGWLTIKVWGPKTCKCECRCGSVIVRSTVNLNASRVKGQTPKCKPCERKERKRKNPGAILNSSPVWYR